MKSIRKWLAMAVYSLVLVGVPMVHNAGLTVPNQPVFQLVCTGSHCGDCC